MIFLSHAGVDKEFIDSIAYKIAEKYGKEGVFYDSWSIVASESITGKMNEGLSESDVFFLFVTSDSLKSRAVEREWNAYSYKEINNPKMKFCAIRCDDVELPPLIADRKYIDYFYEGETSTINQMVDFIENKKPTTDEKPPSFENLFISLEAQKETTSFQEIYLNINIRRFPVTNLELNFLCNLPENEFSVHWLGDGVLSTGYDEQIAENKQLGLLYNRIVYKFHQTFKKEDVIQFKITFDKKALNQQGMDFLVYQIIQGAEPLLIKTTMPSGASAKLR